MLPIPDPHGFDSHSHFSPLHSPSPRNSQTESMLGRSSDAHHSTQPMISQASVPQPPWSVCWVRQEEQLRDIQVFRAQVSHLSLFALRGQPGQLGQLDHLVGQHRGTSLASFSPMPSALDGFEPQGVVQDIFDEYCEHIMVKDGSSGQILAACRLLTPAQAKRVGGLELEHDFDLTRIRAWRSKVLELGRVCIDPRLKISVQRRLLRLLQNQILGFVQSNQLLMVVCMSQELVAQDAELQPGAGQSLKRPSSEDTRALWQHIRDAHLSPFEFHLRARYPLNALKEDGSGANEGVIPQGSVSASLRAAQVTLSEPLRTYLRWGAKVMGQPCWSREHGAIHWALMMRTQDLMVHSSRALRT